MIKLFALAVAALLLAQEAHASRPVPRVITQVEALRIAQGYGMRNVREIERDDGGWEIEGRDHRGRSLEVKVNRYGRVTEVERGDRDDDD